MARVYIPPAMRSAFENREFVEATGDTVLQVIADVDEQLPGFKDRVCVNDALRPGLMVVVNGSASALGTFQRVDPAAEIHFLPALGGG